MKNNFKIIFISLFISIICVFPSFSQDICGEEIWMGWVNIRYDSAGYGCVPAKNNALNQDVYKYGRYGFDYKTTLIDFLDFLDSEYFERWIKMGKGSENLIKEEFGLPEAFSIYYADNKEKVIKKEDEYVYTNYYLNIKNVLRNSGFNLDSYSPYIKGMVFSYTIRKIENNMISQTINSSFATDIINCKNEEDEDKFINEFYKLMIDRFGSNEKEKKKLYKERGDCLDKKEDTYIGKVGERLVINNDVFNDRFVLDIMATSSEVYDDFIDSGKFYEDSQKEWYYHVRNSSDFKEEIGIDSGFLDVSLTSSKGIKANGYVSKVENELVGNVIENGQNIIYLPQNSTIRDYSFEKFGINNVAQCGGSLSCMSMAVNKLLDKSGEFLVTPDKIIEKIKEEKSDVNYYYNEEKMGMENEIITDICDFYGLNGSIIAKNSMQAALSSGSLIVARVSDCEFTTTGNFILLSGFETANSQNCCYVIDPNMAHASFLYNLYPLDYISDISDVLFKISI